MRERPQQDPRLAALEQQVTIDPPAAIHQLRLLIADEPLNVDAYRTLARALAQADHGSGAAGQLRTTVETMDYPLMRASQALASADLETAEKILRERLIQRPTDVNALLLMAQLFKALAYHVESERMLGLALEFQPDFVAARLELAAELQRQNRPVEALAELDAVLKFDATNWTALTIKASALSRAARYSESIALYEQLLAHAGRDATLWIGYGHTLKTVGRFQEGESAIRTAIGIAPSSGVAWWNLSNLKLSRFSAADLRVMEATLEDPEASVEDRFHLHFALGKAMEDAAQYEPAFRHYAEGNSLRKRSLDYDPADVTNEVDQQIQTFTEDFFRDREGWGSCSSEPIFIVGMTRAGSTLIEQILASHSEIEGTMELPDVAVLARNAGRGRPGFWRRLADLHDHDFRAMGEQYLLQTRVHRLNGTPFYIDKMPTNWLLVPLIHLILPNAKIVDARRHPMACGFSNYKQHFSLGQAFSYDLEWFGSYYRDYVRLMAHVDQVLPGRVHRVIHEELVLNPEREVRALLDYLGLPFEDACLRFYETKRAVKTPSSEQVRRPLNAASLDQWRHFEAWLGPLRQSLGDVADVYPAVPRFRA